MSERLVIILGFSWMTLGLVFIAYQTVILARMLADITALVARTH
jgi:hypothetical protein